MNNSNQIAFDFDKYKKYPFYALPNPEVINVPDAEMVFVTNFYGVDESKVIYDELLNDIEWKQDWIKYYGKKLPLPRLTAWYGDRGTNYKYSGIGMTPQMWTSRLKEIKEKIEEFTNTQFNSVLLNLYRDGKDSVSWHQDNEKELGPNPTIASLSFGQVRKFQFRHKFKKDVDKFELLLKDGSLLIMKGATQEFWQHQIPRTSKLLNPRINLTFRYIY
jgi:alkylated DNA repair dioxygenase AlkB